MKSLRLIFKNIELCVIILFILFFAIVSFREISDTPSLLIPIFYIIYCILAIISYIIIKKKYNHHLENKWFCIIYILVIGMIIRMISLYFINIEQKGDYSIYLSTASQLASGKNINNLYYGIFPHAIHYPIAISLFYRLFGVSKLIVSIVHFIFSMIEIVCIYLLLEKTIIKKYSILATFLIILNPSSILLVLFTGGESIYSSLIFVCLLIISNIYSNNLDHNKSKYFILCVTLGLFLSAANFFRPTGIILIIAIILSELLMNNSFNRNIIMRVCTICLTFVIGNMIFQNITTKITGFQTPDKSFGWNLYVGANYDNKGTWNSEDGQLFKDIIAKKNDPSEIQTYFFDLSIERYKYLIKQRKVFHHFMNKSFIWSKESYMPTLISECHLSSTDYKLSGVDKVITLICFIYQNIIFIIMLLSLLICKKQNFLYRIISLYMIGSICLFMLVETATRYKFAYYSIIPTIAIIGCFSFYDSYIVKKQN